MTSIDNLKIVLTKSYTAWVAYLGIAAELGLQYLIGSGLPTWAILGMFALVLLARSIKQQSVSGEDPADVSV